LDGPAPEVIITLLPTHPFRKAPMMRKLTQKAQGEFGLVNSVRPIRVHESSHLTVDVNGRLNPIWADYFPKEALPWMTLHRSYGLFSAYSTTKPYGRVYCHEITDPVEMVDIDTPEDVEVARLILQEGFFSLRDMQ
jgi:hypothetical protein